LGLGTWDLGFRNWDPGLCTAVSADILTDREH